MNHNLTVRQLLVFIEKHKIPMDAEIRTQRIEDQYFNEWNWKSIKKEGYSYSRQQQLNDRVNSGEFDDKSQYPLIHDPLQYKMTDEEMEALKEEYVTSFCCVKYPDDDNLYIDAHY